tara:strand:- start:110 stop:514 length:405 start_codon:yes stop_codon:yes gene_type:complete
MKSRLEKVYSKLPNQKVNLKKHKVDLMLRESEVDKATEIFRSERGALDFILKNQLPDVLNQLRDFISTIDNSENELNNIIDTYKDVMSEYESKANELGIDVETIAEYNFIDTRVFEANQQLEIASELKDSINNI